MKNYKLDIKKIDDRTLTDILENSNFKKFRKSQIKTWLFKKFNKFSKFKFFIWVIETYET